ncbi:hypothetical protein SAMN05421630_111138 [Prauserella marina]|uniref:Uncharacterized protein n=2 Tax=Prauserella marina TaxID=530584 RepID=A0A1G6WVQ4_9PSEU|nr:hypothetical protein DES30_109135 [Prauserella marina]SDD69884.1 hypothetical protein SAMN05421630_111138 [Prauserella marina]
MRRWTALLERHRQAALADTTTDSEWQAGFCEGLRHAQHVIRKGD